MRKTMMLGMLLVACGTAHAADWVSTGKGPDGREYLADASSIKIKDGLRRVWIKTIFQPHTMRETADGKWWNSAVGRQAFNCDDETFRLEGLIVYFEDGTSNLTDPKSFPTQWQPVPPETGLNAEMKFICAWKAK
jgi:hypothetical protein